MNTATRVAVVTVAVAGAIGLGGLALMSPAVAGTLTHPFAVASGGPGGHGSGGMGNGMGRGARGDGVGTRGGGMGAGGMGSGDCTGLAITAGKGALTEAQRAALAGLAQEEQLAQDLYAAFADRYDAVVFDHVGAAETRHLTALRTLMDRYGVADPTKDRTAGSFGDQGVQATYDRLLATGGGSEQAALQAGKTVEQADVDDLGKALETLSAPDAKQVYTFLADASRRHLTAFDRWAGR